MATYIGQEARYTDYIKPYNFDLIASGLQAKQGAYDTGRAVIQNEVNSLVNIDLARGVDKEYFNQRVNNLISQVNEFGNADLSLSGNVQTINSALKTAVDSNVITAAASTKNLRKLQATIDYYKTKKVDQYSTANEAFALRGAQEWLNNGEVGAGYSGSEYNPYIDVSKTQLDKIKAFKDLKGDQVIKVPLYDSNGNMTDQVKTTTVKGLTSEEILAYIPNILDQKELQQLQINGWAKYQGQGGLASAQMDFADFSKSKISEIDSQIELFKKGEDQSGLSASAKKEYTKNRQALEHRKANITSELSNVNINDSAALGGFLEKNNWMTNFAQMAAGRVSEEFDKNDIYFARENLKLDKIAEQRLQNESALSMQEKQLDIAKKQIDLNEKAATLQDSGISLTPAVGDLKDEINPVDDSLKTFAINKQSILKEINTVFNSASSDKQDLYKAERDKFVNQNKDYATASALAFSKIFGATNPDVLEKVNNLNYSKNQIAVGLTKARDEAITEKMQEKPDKLFNDLQRVAQYYPEVKKFMLDNKISAANVTQTDNLRKSLDYISKAAEDYAKSDQSNEDYSTTTFNLLKYIDIEDPYKNPDIVKRQNEILKDKGYTGFTTSYVANITKESDRTVIKNALAQSSGGYVFDDKQPMTIKKVEGGLQVIQNIEGTQKGIRFGNTAPRTAIIPKDSDLYNNLSKKINFEADKTLKLSNNTPKVYSSNIDYMDTTDERILRKSSELLKTKTGGKVLPNSAASPDYYLTSVGTKKVYNSVLSDIIPTAKLNTLVDLMQANANNKLQVKAEVEDGNWIVSVKTKNNGTIRTIGVEEQQGSNQDNSEVLMFVQQYPQITASEAILKYLKNSPEKIDELIEDLK